MTIRTKTIDSGLGAVTNSSDRRLRTAAVSALLGAIACGLAAVASAQPPMSPEELALLREGVRLHDQGQYEQAIERYQAALAIDETNASAYHQIAFAAAVMGDHRRCLESARRGLRQGDGTTGAQLFSIGGSCADELGELDVAGELYAAGVAEHPDDQRLLYNYAVHELLGEDRPAALSRAERSLDVNPFHASTHHLVALTLAFQERDELAILAALRFLALEPNGPRALAMLGVIESLSRRMEQADPDAADTDGSGATSTVAPGGAGDETAGDEGEDGRSLGTVRVQAPLDEGDEADLVEMVRSAVGAAAAFSPDGEPSLPGEDRRAGLQDLIARQAATIARLEPDADPLESRYRSYAAAVHDAELTDAFTRYVMQMVGEGDLQQWVEANQEIVGRLIEFLRSTP